ncbi:hypothetical protein JH26_26060 [Microvirga sp. BSC39]|nr:hypothetical protein JH26_26060 [Microvirga sp. BSC39]
MLGVAFWMLRPEPIPDLLGDLPVRRNPAEWDQVSRTMTEQLRRNLPPGSREESVVETLSSQGFKAVGSAEDKDRRFLFERQDFPCVERFIVQLTFDDAHRLQDVLGHYRLVCL